MATMHINKENFENEVIHSEKPVLVDFWAPWCGPCRELGPIVDALAEELTDVKVAKVNVDEERELAKRYRIFSIPTLVVIKDGQVVNKSVGVQSREEILQML
jgi:thioredoxin 1